MTTTGAASPGLPIARAFPDNPVIASATIGEILRDTQLYLLFIVGRSGSTWLTEMASRGGRLGTPHEFFNDGWLDSNEIQLRCRPPSVIGTRDINAFARSTVAEHRAPSGVFGLELAYPQLLNLKACLEPGFCLDRRIRSFFLRRRNIVAQAISSYRSVASGFWHSTQNDPDARRRFAELGYDAEGLDERVSDVVACEQGLDAAFAECGIKPLQFFYEDLLASPNAVLSWMDRAVTGNNDDAPPIKRGTIVPISDHLNRSWEGRYRAERAAFLASAIKSRPPMRSDFAVSFRSGSFADARVARG